MTPEKLNRVLCINDNDITLFILKRTLAKSNFAAEIIEKKNGKEGIDYCKQIIKGIKGSDNYPMVIFLDLHMPIMGGWEFLDRFSDEIWHFFRDTKIVITSHSIDNNDSLRAKEYPFVIDFLKTPITVEYLTKLRENLMQGYSFQN